MIRVLPLFLALAVAVVACGSNAPEASGGAPTTSTSPLCDAACGCELICAAFGGGHCVGRDGSLTCTDAGTD